MKNNDNQTNTESNKRILTIPNAMSFFRIILILVFIWLYHWREQYLSAVVVLLISYLTDLSDGWVARRFNMVSDAGKALDPVADKISQGVLMLCLVLEFPILLIPLILFIVKECIMGAINLLTIHRTGEVHGAEMHGKITTCLIDLLIFVHVLWHGIPFALSLILSAICIASMVISFVLYATERHRMKH